MKIRCFIAILTLTVLVNLAKSQDFSSQRIGDAQFHVFLTPRTFAEATTGCQQIDENTQLASVRNEEEFSFLENFFEEDSISEILILGLSREEDTDGNDPLSFNFVDGFEDKSFIEFRENLPWSPTEPTGFGAERCVIWHIPGSANIDRNRWDDVSCDESRGFLCRTQLPPENRTSTAVYKTSLAISAVILLLLTYLSAHKLYKKSQKYERVKLRLENEIMKNNQFKDFKLPNLSRYTFAEDQSLA